MEKLLDKVDGIAGAKFMDLAKVFDTLNHELLIEKVRAYGFNENTSAITLYYLSERWQITWLKILLGVPLGSVQGHGFVNLYIDDLFYHFINSFGDDTSLSAFVIKLEQLLHNLE